MKNYRELHAAYIASPTWQARRAAYYETHDRRCRACGSTRAIHLHHATYKRVGHEKDGDLFPLCAKCHLRVHQLHERSEGALTLRQATQHVIKPHRKRGKPRKARKPRNRRNRQPRRVGSQGKPPANLSPYGDDGRTAA